MAIITPASALASSTFSVTPAFQSASLDASPSVHLTITLSNETPKDQNFRLSVADFGSLNESGGVAFLGEGSSQLDHRYGLASWLQLNQNVIFVAAGKSAEIGVTVENRESLAPGGHYGAVLATAVTDTGVPQPLVAQVGVKAVLSSLILLTKTGGALPQLTLVSETSHHSAAQLPGSVVQRFQNPGNVHVVPRGVIQIIDPAGRIVASGALNESSSFILPESYRKLPVTLSNLAKPWYPGRYVMKTVYRFDGTDATKTYWETFWYIGSAAVIVSWIIIATLFAFGAGWGIRKWRK